MTGRTQTIGYGETNPESLDPELTRAAERTEAFSLIGDAVRVAFPNDAPGFLNSDDLARFGMAQQVAEEAAGSVSPMNPVRFPLEDAVRQINDLRAQE